jgi:hypothetical protein
MELKVQFWLPPPASTPLPLRRCQSSLISSFEHALRSVIFNASIRASKARTLRLRLKVENSHRSTIVLEAKNPSGGYLCLFTNIFAKSVARLSPSQCQSASTTKNGCPAATAPKRSSKFSPFSRRHREKADDPLGRRGFHGIVFLLLLLAQFALRNG